MGNGRVERYAPELFCDEVKADPVSDCANRPKIEPWY